MQVDKELLNVLAGKAQCYQDQVPVFRIRQMDADELHADVLKTFLPFTSGQSPAELRYKINRSESVSRLLLPEGATLDYFHVSGYRQYCKHLPPFESRITDNTDELDMAGLTKAAPALLEKYRLNGSGALDTVSLERLWQLKACGMTSDGEKSKVAVTRLVYAYRRALAGLPVWGSASVYLKTAGGGEVDEFGIDWRPVHEAHIHKAFVLNPQEGAVRALEELQHVNPEKPLTTEDFSVESFSLGYFSGGKRSFQSFMQPVWVARFISRGFSGMGHVIVVPATNTAYEPVSRIAAPPPFNEKRTSMDPKNCSCHGQNTLKHRQPSLAAIS